MNTPSKRTGRRDKIKALTIQYLDQLTNDDLQALARFAKRRLDWVPRSQLSAEDAVHKALHSIICGTWEFQEARRPREENLRTKGAFLHYVRSSINSVIDAAKRKRELWVIHETIHREKEEEEHTTIILAAIPGAEENLDMVDLKNELFARLRAIAPSRLLPSIDEWEKTFFWASKIPFKKSRDYRPQVRRLAMQVLKEIAADLSR